MERLELGGWHFTEGGSPADQIAFLVLQKVDLKVLDVYGVEPRHVTGDSPSYHRL